MTKRVHGCTIVAANYSAHARVLAESFHRHHPDGTFTTLIIDRFGAPFAPDPRTRYLTPDRIGIGNDELRRMAAMYEVTEFATSVKPWLLQSLLDEGRDHILYFDPDIEIFASMSQIAASAEDNGIVLTPHALAPYSAEAADGERAVRLAGIYNLGFVGVGATAGGFLEFWRSRLRRDCRIALDEGIFVDQRWVDFVPALFPCDIWRDPTYNVAWWNLHQRAFDERDGGYIVDGRPLMFFHFSGYSPHEPYALTKHQGPRPWVFLSENRALQRICDEYRTKLIGCGFEAASLERYGWRHLAESGVTYDERMRRLYSDALRDSEESNGRVDEPPNPFEDERGFLAWLNESLAPPGAMPLSRYLDAVYRHRGDLPQRFPDLRWSSDGEAFVEWVRTVGRLEESIPDELVPRRSVMRRPAAGSRRSGGVNVVGYLQAEDGIGEAGRQMLGAVGAAGLDRVVVVERGTATRQQHPLDGVPSSSVPIFDTSIICINADRLLAFRHEVGPTFFDGRRSIGVWWWELSEFPESMHGAFATLDEVWTGSRFVRDALVEHSPLPVRVFPQPVVVPRGDCLTRSELGFPNGFLFLFMFDFLSVVERKNPMAVIEAFARAFPRYEGAHLVVKSVNGHLRPYEIEKLRYAAEATPGVTVIDGHVPAAMRDAMMASADCYVSLHRSEGFGMTMAEALSVGVPVIASRYSGPLEFLNDENSYLVDCEEASVPAGCGPYPKGSRWGAPDIDHAAVLMREVVENTSAARSRAARGREHIRANHGQEQLAEFLSRHLCSSSPSHPGALRIGAMAMREGS